METFKKTFRIVITDAPIKQTIAKAFQQGTGFPFIKPEEVTEEDNIIVQGLKRNTPQAIKISNNYVFIDNGYFKQSNPKQSCNGYYRVCYNSLIHNGQGNYNWDRFNKLKIELKPWKTNGVNVVVIPTSIPVAKFLRYDPDEWLQNITKKIKQHTDRPIIICRKYQKPSLQEVLNNCWILVTDISNASVDVLTQGIPVITTSLMRQIGRIEDIETPIYERDWIKNLCYHQWTLKQIESGQCWKELCQTYNF